MDVVHLNQKQLAARWNISEATLERWRSVGIGPKFLKLCGREYPALLSGQEGAVATGRGHREPETTKATDRSVAFTHPMLARLAVILAKKPQDVARQKVAETRIVPQDLERLCNGWQFHAMPPAWQA